MGGAICPGHASSFGAKLRQFREAAALSQEELASRSGLSVRGISDLERGARTTPRLETVCMLAEGLGLDESQKAELLAARNALTIRSQGGRGEVLSALPKTSNSFIG